MIDALAPDGTETLYRRLGKEEEKSHFDEVIVKMSETVASEIGRLTAVAETWDSFTALMRRIRGHGANATHQYFYAGMVIKFLFSCLIDADRKDSADFQDPQRLLLNNEGAYIAWEKLESRLEARLAEFPLRNRVDEIRAKISEECRLAGGRGKGIYLLTVPTGGGKTLASLRFAFRHARERDMKRVFYVIPYTSIIDQNADQVRRILEGDRNGESLDGKVVLEHHSNLTPDEENSAESPGRELGCTRRVHYERPISRSHLRARHEGDQADAPAR